MPEEERTYLRQGWLDRLLNRPNKPLESLWDQVRKRNIPGTEEYKMSLEDIITREASITGENPYYMMDRLLGSRWREGPDQLSVLPQEDILPLMEKPILGYRHSGQKRGVTWKKPSWGGEEEDLVLGLPAWGQKNANRRF